MLSELDEREHKDFGAFERKIRFFEINDTPYKDDIYMVKSSDCAVKAPIGEPEYVIVDRSETELIKFVSVAEVVAPVQYNPE